MRALRGSWIGTAAFVAGCIGGASGSTSDKLHGLKASDTSISNGLDKPIDTERVIITVITSDSIVDGQHILQADDGISALRDNLEEDIVTMAATTQSATTRAYPKITAAPLFKRKLGSNRWDVIHEGIQGQKRDAAQCPADYQLCPKSLHGGCCPNDRVCGSSSCYPASSAPASACGQLGYTACGASDGGGCCPSGYVCGQAGCSPSAGVSYSQTCGIESFLCPASFNYGCCKNGMGCALNSCYSTDITTFTETETITTTDESSNPHTITSTITSEITPSAPTATAVNESNLIPKLPSSATAIPKVYATGSSSNTGLSTPAIGGIIGASVTFLIIILVVATLIIRRLNVAIKVTERSNSRTTSSCPRIAQPPLRQMQVPDVDSMSVDPLMMTGSEEASSIRHTSYQSTRHSSAHEVEANSPPLFNSPFSPYPPPSTHYPPGYNPVATSESNYSQSSSGYFDLPIQSNHRGSEGSVPTRRPSQHGRNWSNASDQSQVSQVSSEAAELEASSEGPRSGLQRALHGLGMGRMVSRRRNDSVGLTGGPSRPTPASPGLGHIPEASESQHQVDLLGHVGVRGLSGAQLREAGLSNSQLREMTMSGVSNPYVDPAQRPAPRVDDKEYG